MGFLNRLLIIILIIYLTAPAQHVSTSTDRAFLKNNVNMECRVFYFINAILLERSELNTTLALETPGNVTFYSINQTSIPLIYRNVVFNSTAESFVFNITINSSFYGYHVLKIRVCYPDIQETLDNIAEALQDPKLGSTSGEIPEDIRNDYLKEPYRRVVEVVGSNYTDWFMSRYGYNVTHASPLGIAATAAYFVYKVYFKYDASGLPRTMDEVIDSRKGDCDDLSRILVELLNAYGIPATIAYGYVYLPQPEFENYDITIRNFTYIFRYNGPHAFTLAYIPGRGWVSLDFLAGSLLTYDFVFEGFSRVTYVNETEVKEVEELHAKIHGVQFMALFSEDFFKVNFDQNNLTSSIETYINRTLIKLTSSTTTAVTTTSTETTSETVSETTYTSVESGPREYSNQSSSTGMENGLALFPIALLLVIILLLVVIIIIMFSESKTRSSPGA